MSIRREKALGRMKGLAARIEEHLDKLANEPENLAAEHWRFETVNRIAQVEALNRHVGAKTGADWEQKITAWKIAIGN
ncbi:MAG TPA: hypothetical protein VG406_02465 [Isosphaeraceae bacterium]|jgi:hypothetical protein|nr:hypothetical protein [Isosphaeraceae bacterium]